MKIKVYSTSQCPYCVSAKDFLKKYNIQFEEVDVGKDHKAAMEMIKVSGQTGVPVIEIKKSHSVGIIIGFAEEELKKALNIQQ